jgi:hypothetical protein
MSSESETFLTLHIAGAGRGMSAAELEPMRSPHTGLPIRRLRVRFRAPASDSKAIADALGQARSLERPLSSADGSRWVVTSSSYSYADGDRAHWHVAELREVEDLRAERLEMLGLTLVPTRYKEEAEEEQGIIVIAQVEPDSEVDEALEGEIMSQRKENMYFDVLRVGVSDAPMRMRFGRCLWQRTEQGRAHLLRLVSEAGDSEERRHGGVFALMHQPELSVTIRKAAVAHGTAEALIEELVGAGVLSSEAVERIRARAEEARENRDRALDEARDLDRHF